jgi:formylglycine-generating enzyme required for sulfatase activity
MKGCSDGGSVYPYGNAYEPLACNGADYGQNQAIPVGQALACHGTSVPRDEIHDMSGNVWEWEDSCNGSVSPNDQCVIRGGAYLDVPSALTCAVAKASSRDTMYYHIGFRCCAP